MESSLDEVEDGDTSGSTVWHKFVTDFRNMHNNALELRKQKPTVKQYNLIKNRTSRMSEDVNPSYSKVKQSMNLREKMQEG